MDITMVWCYVLDTGLEDKGWGGLLRVIFFTAKMPVAWLLSLVCVWGVVSHWHRGVACECGVSPMSALAIQNLQQWGGEWAGGRAVSAGSMFRAMSWLDGAPEIVLIQMAEPLVTATFSMSLDTRHRFETGLKVLSTFVSTKGFVPTQNTQYLLHSKTFIASWDICFWGRIVTSRQ